MFYKKTLHDFDVNGKKILLRADFNVPLTDEGEIESNFRITQSLPTIRALQERGCKGVICSHLGRPSGPDDAKFSLRPVAKELEKLLGQKVTFVDDCVGEQVKHATNDMQAGDVVLLENLRFHPEEENNDEQFARALVESTGAEVFVQDGFGVVHRAHASTDAVARIIPAVAGLLLAKEVDTITEAIHNPTRPLMAIIGGAKIEDKIDIIYKFLDIADIVIIGGAMANTFLKAQGVEVGDSLYDEGELDTAHNIIDKVREICAHRKLIFYLPQDGIVATEIAKDAHTRIVDWDAHFIATVESYPKKPTATSGKVKKHEKILDIGPFSAAFISGAMQLCGTVVWNGTMGVSETPALRGPIGPFAHGTEAIMDSIVGKYGNRPFSVVGGGDTAAYVEARGMNDMFSHVSTGGGASLELMAGKDLPGVSVLWDKEG